MQKVHILNRTIKKDWFFGLVIAVVFFVLGVLTLNKYGINWDTINHLPRGQAYLNYLLHGKKDYSNYPEYVTYWQNPKSLAIDSDIDKNKVSSKSIYQLDSNGFDWFIQKDGEGHPPFSDIVSSVFNRILFGNLKIINDIDAYRVYGVFLASCLIFLIYYWVSSIYGKFAGFVSSITLGLYPLFWSEMHFNTEKDIPETVFWSFSLFFIWKAIRTKKYWYLLLAGLALGAGLGTKFNIIFICFVLAPWLIVKFIFEKYKLHDYLKLAIFGFGAALLALTIFIGTWPYLWADPITRIQGVVGFYKGIGTTQNFDVRYIGPFGINTYALQAIIYSTPIVTLALGVVGFFVGLKRVIKLKDTDTLLFISWLCIPLIRVTMPGANIYGGLRQIMEYIPALAVFTGIGAHHLVESLKKYKPLNKFSVLKNKFAIILGILVFIGVLFPIIKYQPNENVFFNPLMGGLSGAKQKDFLFWGNSFGAAYRQGIVWINDNAPKGSKVAYARELIPNIPRHWLRGDLSLHNGNRSGVLRQGEYIIALTYDDTDKTAYFDRYLEKFLTPVYEVKADSVAILKVWKNDLEHTKTEYRQDKKLSNFKVSKTQFGITFDLGQVEKLSSLRFNIPTTNCNLTSSYIKISSDGQLWQRLPGVMPKEDWSVPKYGNQPDGNKVFVPFAADEAKFIQVITEGDNNCLQKLYNPTISIF